VTNSIIKHKWYERDGCLMLWSNILYSNIILEVGSTIKFRWYRKDNKIFYQILRYMCINKIKKVSCWIITHRRWAVSRRDRLRRPVTMPSVALRAARVRAPRGQWDGRTGRRTHGAMCAPRIRQRLRGATHSFLFFLFLFLLISNNNKIRFLDQGPKPATRIRGRIV
jgi:hypothetical protein